MTDNFNEHHRDKGSGKDEWLTPKYIIDALGPFDLDPCASIVRPWDTANRYYTIEDDGLKHPWEGRVWLNPPYIDAVHWLSKMARHNYGTVLVFARTETKMFFRYVWPKASGILFLDKRLCFFDTAGWPANHNAGAPSVLISYGRQDAEILRDADIDGFFIDLDASRAEVERASS